jgi:hypothetical protein
MGADDLEIAALRRGASADFAVPPVSGSHKSQSCLAGADLTVAWARSKRGPRSGSPEILALARWIDELEDLRVAGQENETMCGRGRCREAVGQRDPAAANVETGPEPGPIACMTESTGELQADDASATELADAIRAFYHLGLESR